MAANISSSVSTTKKLQIPFKSSLVCSNRDTDASSHNGLVGAGPNPRELNL